jgi:4'-phosphopantetheinyl transferase
VTNSGEIHVWHVDLSAAPELIERGRALLTPDELRRAERRVLPVHKTRFLLSHLALRCILALYLGISPEAVSVAHTLHGKPRLQSDDQGALEFNLSHSGDLALVAVSSDAPVGVDIERVRPWGPGVDDAPAHVFGARERCQLAAVPARLRPEAFTRCWTRKEAIAKAIGTGLSSALAAMDVGVWPLDEPAGPRFGQGSPVRGWMLAELPTAAGYVASVAWPGAARRLVNRPVSAAGLVAAYLDRGASAGTGLTR